jgi:hypothetical protein
MTVSPVARAISVMALTFSLGAPCARSAAAASVDHAPWDRLLKQYVDEDGKVAYRRLKAEDGDALAAYLATLAAAKLDDLPEKEQLAFWINAYNAMIVGGILDGYSAENALKRYRFFKSYSRTIAGEPRTPDDLEHQIIRPRFHDARTHFAVVCASTSCPVLRREAYAGARLDAQLDDQARRFLDDPHRNRIDPTSGSVEVSQIFKWFKDDFTRDGKTLADFLAPYLTPVQVQLLRDNPPSFLDYDWTMNAQSGQRP